MHKIAFLILISILLLTGCTYKKIDENNIDNITDILLIKKLNLFNHTAKGYKYYLPKGVKVIDNTNYNERLFANGNVYYLYIDIVNFHYKKPFSYTINEDAFFSKPLKYKNEGYLEINKINDKYFIEMMYNYAKIETFVKEKDIGNTIINISYILSSLKFNDNIIDLIFDEDILNYDEKKFDIFESKGREGNFLDYVNEYDVFEEEAEDIIINEQNMVE